MTGQGLSPAPAVGTSSQPPLEQSQASPRSHSKDVYQGNRREDHDGMDADVVDAEADVVDTLLTMRELASNTASNDRMLKIAASVHGYLRRESAEDDQGTHRSDSAATGHAVIATAGHSREGFSAQRLSGATCNVSGTWARPNSGVAPQFLASRPNSFSGRKRKPTTNCEDALAGGSQFTQFPSSDVREGAAVTAADTAALQLLQQAEVATPEALGWRPGVASAGVGGTGGGLPMNTG